MDLDNYIPLDLAVIALFGLVGLRPKVTGRVHSTGALRALVRATHVENFQTILVVLDIHKVDHV